MKLAKLPSKAPLKVKPLDKLVRLPSHVLKKLAFPKDFKAAVVSDKEGVPQYVVFDTHSLWDILCAVDAKIEETSPAKEYVASNPVGWLIDALESYLPLKPKFVFKLRKGIKEAQKSGPVSFEKVISELGLL